MFSKKLKIDNKAKEKEETNLIKINFNMDQLDLPPPEIIKNNEQNRKINYSYYLLFKNIFSTNNYDQQLKKLKFNDDSLVSIDITGDGNCLYRSISYFLASSQIYHLKIRKALFNYVIDNFETIVVDYPYTYYNGNTVNTEDYIPLIEKNGEYGGELECQLLTKIFDINILILNYQCIQLNEDINYEQTEENDDNNYITYYSFYEYFGDFNRMNYVPLCILDYNQLKKHYMNLYYNENYKGDIILNDSEILKEISEKEEIKDNSLLNISSIYKKQKILKEKNKESENIDLQKPDSNKIIKENSKIIENNVNSLNNNLSAQEIENNDVNKLKSEKYLNDKQLEKLNSVDEKNNKEINSKLINYNINEENKEIIKNKKVQNIELVLKNAESLKIINNCLINEQKPLNEIESSIELAHKDNRHKPFDYPIYPYDSDDPEGFYANVYNYLLNRAKNPFSLNYPKFIYEEKEELIRENKKRLFRRKAENFEINNFGNLCYKIPDYGDDEENSYNSEENDFNENESKINKIDKHNK